jgi:hypothetical protein
VPSAVIAAEPVIRLSCFSGVLVLMALWEALSPRRPQSVRRLLRWPNNLGLVVLNTFVVRLIEALQPALGRVGLERLKQRMIALSAEPVRKLEAKERQVVGWGSGGAIYADDLAERSRVSAVRSALQDIADAQGDVDAFIAQYEEPVRKVPKIAAKIARRLLAAGRAEEAWQTIEETEHRPWRA